MVEFHQLWALRNDFQTGAAQAESQCLNEMCAHRLSLQHPWKGSICWLCTPALECSQLAGRTRGCALGQELGCCSWRLKPESAFQVFDSANMDASSTVFVSKSLRCHGIAGIFPLWPGQWRDPTAGGVWSPASCKHSSRCCTQPWIHIIFILS